MAKSYTCRNIGTTKGRHTFSPAVSRTQTLAPIEAPALAQIPVFALAQASALALTISFIDKLFWQLIKTYAATVKLLEQNQAQGAGPCKKPLKA